ncbi:MAG: FKBP-type peptidyl-prolyl cis-trans isomerase [Steroidobacteraceae bacterium]
MPVVRLVALLSLALLPCAAGAAAPSAAATGKSAATAPATDNEKTLYALGALLSRAIETFELTPAELKWVQAGLGDAVAKKPLGVPLETFGPKVQELQGARMAARAAREKTAGEAFVAKAAAEPGATRTASGIVITTLQAGSGAAPQASDQVKVHYEGKLLDGTVFDSSLKRGEPAVFPLGGVIKCWTEGVQSMKVGGRARLVCPADTAYGDRGAPPTIPGNATLVFEVQLLEIVKPQAGAAVAPPPPPDAPR